MKKSFLTIALLSVTLSLLAACAQRPQTAEAAVENAEAQQVENVQADLAPDFELPDLQGNLLKLIARQVCRARLLGLMVHLVHPWHSPHEGGLRQV